MKDDEFEQIPGAKVEHGTFWTKYEIEGDEFLLVLVKNHKGAGALNVTATLTAAGVNVAGVLYSYSIRSIIEIMQSSTCVIPKLISAISTKHVALDILGKVMTGNKINDSARIVETTNLCRYMICAPFHYAYYAMPHANRSDDEWRRVLNWPEPLHAECTMIAGPKEYSCSCLVKITSTMTKMYGRIDDGTVPGYKTTIGRIFSVQMSKTTQKTTGDKIGKTVDGGSLYYVTPGVYVLPRTKPYNYLVYKEGCVAPATHEIKFDRVMTMIDIVDGYRKLNIPAEDYRTQAEKLPRDECAICLSDEADWVCAGCFKGYACIECGRLDKCPLCRYDFN